MTRTLQRFLLPFALTMAAATASHASLSGTIYSWQVPKISGEEGNQTIWEPLSCTFDINTTKVDLDFAAWLYAVGWSPTAQSRATVKILINGAVYDTTNFIIAGAKPITPNAIYDKYVPESALTYGPNDVQWSISFNGFQSPGIWQTFEVKATVIRS